MATTIKKRPKPKQKTPSDLSRGDTKVRVTVEEQMPNGEPVNGKYKEVDKQTGKFKPPEAKKVKQKKQEVLYKEVCTRLCSKINTGQQNEYGALSVEDALDMLGWEVVDKEEDKGQFLFRDLNGARVRLTKNPTNRPFRMVLAKRYMSEILRGKWKLNGETIVIDRMGNVQSGQHRLVALILAEQERRKNLDKYKEYGWKSPIVMETVVVLGISEDKETVDTLDLGQRRSLGDVIYRDGRFEGNDKIKKQQSNILSNATRLAWLRSRGGVVTDAPHFPHSEALDFIEEHPGLIDCTLFIWEKEGGAGVNGGRVSRFISMGYAAGLMYLMSVSGTEPGEYQEDGASALNDKLKDKAEAFWDKFASGAELKADDPIHILRDMLPRIDASSAFGRDEKVAMVIKAFNIWMDGGKAQAKHITVRKSEDDMGRPKLAEEPRLGGIDVEEPPKEEEVLAPKNGKPPKVAKNKIPKHREKRDDRVGTMAGETWAAEDTAWVRSQDGEHWFGTITEIYEIEGDGGNTADIRSADDDKIWNEDVVNLSLDFPSP